MGARPWPSQIWPFLTDRGKSILKEMWVDYFFFLFSQKSGNNPTLQRIYRLTRSIPGVGRGQRSSCIQHPRLCFGMALCLGLVVVALAGLAVYYFRVKTLQGERWDFYSTVITQYISTYILSLIMDGKLSLSKLSKIKLMPLVDMTSGLWYFALDSLLVMLEVRTLRRYHWLIINKIVNNMILFMCSITWVLKKAKSMYMFFFLAVKPRCAQ